MKLSGIAASPGFAAGPVFRFEREELPVRESAIPPEDVETELARFHAALEKSRRDVVAIRDGIAAELGEHDARIYDAHLLILDDPDLIDTVEKGVREMLLYPGYVFRAYMSRVAGALEKLEDEYLRERRADIVDCERRVLRELLGKGRSELESLTAPAVIVAHDLGPSEVAMLPRERVLAFVLEIGGRTSHGAIVARGRGIPAVVSVRDALLHARTGDIATVDGFEGLVEINPDAARRGEFDARAARLQRKVQALEALSAAPCETLDGRPMELGANLEQPEDVDAAVRGGRAVDRALPHRVLLHEPRRPAGRGGAVPRLPPRHRGHAGPARDLSHHGPGRRQGRVVPRHDARDEPVPRAARHPPGAHEPGHVPHADPRDLPRQRARQGADDVPDGLERGRAASARWSCATRRSTTCARAPCRFDPERRDRHHDRDAERRVDGRRARQARAVLLDRLQRPDPVHARDGPRQPAPGPPLRTARPGRAAQHPPHRARRRTPPAAGSASAARWRATRRTPCCCSAWAWTSCRCRCTTCRASRPPSARCATTRAQGVADEALACPSAAPVRAHRAPRDRPAAPQLPRLRTARRTGPREGASDRDGTPVEPPVRRRATAAAWPRSSTRSPSTSSRRSRAPRPGPGGCPCATPTWSPSAAWAARRSRPS